MANVFGNIIVPCPTIPTTIDLYIEIYVYNASSYSDIAIEDFNYFEIVDDSTSTVVFDSFNLSVGDSVSTNILLEVGKTYSYYAYASAAVNTFTDIGWFPIDPGYSNITILSDCYSWNYSDDNISTYNGQFTVNSGVGYIDMNGQITYNDNGFPNTYCNV